MGLTDDAREWWQETLLGQQMSAHPAFGSDINVHVDGDVVTLTGAVQTVDEIEEVEREVKSLGLFRMVVNHLSAVHGDEKYRMQTVLALFPGESAAEIARQATNSWTFHEDDPAEVYCRREEAEPRLTRLADAAHVPMSALDEYFEALDEDQALLIARVPEDDCLRIISALEGTSAGKIRTLPPEADGGNRVSD